MPEATNASQAVVDLVKHIFSLAWRSWRAGLPVAFGVVLGAGRGVMVLGAQVVLRFWWCEISFPEICPVLGLAGCSVSWVLPARGALCEWVGWRMPQQDPASREELGVREETPSPALPL